MTLGDAVSGFLGPQHVAGVDADEAQRRMRALLGLLGEERRILERLVQKLASAAMLAEAGEDEFIGMATDEVIDTESDLGAMEVARAMMVADICDLLGFANELTLSQLAQVAPEHLREPLESRRVELVQQLEEMEAYRGRGRRAVEERLGRLEAGLGSLAAPPGTYEPPPSSSRS